MVGIVIVLGVIIFLSRSVQDLYTHRILLGSSQFDGKHVSLVNVSLLKKQLTSWGFWSPNVLLLYKGNVFYSAKVDQLVIKITNEYDKNLDNLSPLVDQNRVVFSAGNVSVEQGTATLTLYFQEKMWDERLASTQLLNILYTVTHITSTRVGTEDYVQAMRELDKRTRNGETYLEIR